MKVKMKDNLVERYEKALPGELEGSENGYETAVFLESIENKEVELVFTTGDAFEKNDNNVWLPDTLWEEVTVDDKALGDAPDETMMTGHQLKKLKPQLDIKAVEIGEVENVYGCVLISNHEGRHFWTNVVEDGDCCGWKEIPKYLYDALRKHQDELDKGE